MSLILNVKSYIDYYVLKFPTHEYISNDDSNTWSFEKSNIIQNKIANINDFLVGMMNNNISEKYPIIEGINNRCLEILYIVHTIFNVKQSIHTTIEYFMQNTPKMNLNSKSKNKNQAVLEYLLKFKITRKYIETYPSSIYTIISNALDDVRLNAPLGFSSDAYKLLLRPELEKHALFIKSEQTNFTTNEVENSLSSRLPVIADDIAKTDAVYDEDGMEYLDTKLLRLRYPTDLRIYDVRHFLNSSTPIIIDMVQAPNITDHEFIEEQEKTLYATTIRTMALPVGRGMFNLRTVSPSVTECLSIPKLCLTGKDALKGSTIEIQQIEIPPNMNMWPSFHNGVAAGLKITPDSKDIDSTWIVFNKTKTSNDSGTEHAGFLMALGLNGHLKSLSFMNIYEYLVKCDEMTNLGLLLGISTAHRGK